VTAKKDSDYGAAATLTGGEIFSVIQAGVSVQTTVGAVAALSNSTGSTPALRSTVTRLRSAIAAAIISNAVTAQPLIAPSAWVASHTYFQGQAVTNGGNVYYCKTGGASAGSGGPTGTGTAPITDNVAVWYYAGPSFTSNANAPTFSQVGAGSKYTTGNFWSTTSCTYASGAIAQIADTGNFLATGGIFTDSTTGIASPASSMTQSVSFMTDSPAFQVVFNGSAGGPNVMIYVTDPAIGPGPIPLTLAMGNIGSGGISPTFYQLVFATRRPRLITVEAFSGNLKFYGVLTNDPISKVWQPDIPNSVRWGIVGSTMFSVASPQQPVIAQLGVGQLVAKLLGAVDYIVDVQGNQSGYLSAGTNGTFLTRIATLTSYAPDVVLVSGGGLNDRTASGSSLSTEQAAVLAYITAVRAALPNALIFVVGSEGGATGPATNVFTMELAMNQAVTAFADPYTFFLPQSSTVAEKAWISGTGTSVAPNASGNSDLYIGTDAVNPVQAGTLYLAQQHAQNIIGVVNSIKI
jgi:hypothetical protein